MLRRIIREFKDEGLAGLFKQYWGRCLLWRRAGSSLNLIDFSPNPERRVCRRAPTWSWMAWDGVINFLAVGDKTLDWNLYNAVSKKDGIKLPKMDNGRATSTGKTTSWLSTARCQDSVAIAGVAFQFTVPLGTGEDEAYICFDSNDVAPAGNLKCLIIGSQIHFSHTEMRKHYVMIIRQRDAGSSGSAYERVGVGSIIGKFIVEDSKCSILVD